MKLGKFVFLFLLLAASVFSQSRISPDSPKNNQPSIVAEQRTARLKADILREIEKSGRKDQAKFYVALSDILWTHDQKEAVLWLAKGVEIGISPATEYKNDAEKLSGLWNLLNSTIKKDEVLSSKLIVKIKEIKIDESNLETLKAANGTYITIAQQILSRKRNENLAFEFAMLSLKGRKPAVNQMSLRFLLEMQSRNENLANAYFEKLVECAKNNNLFGIAVHYLFGNGSDIYSRDFRREAKDAQIKMLLEIMLSLIQKETDDLSFKKINNCILTTDWGVKFSESFIQFLPEKFPIIVNAISTCQNSAIESWRKPAFVSRPRRTSQDFLELAKEISDKQIQLNYLQTASSKARDERNFQLANDILDGINKEDRNFFWVWSKVYTNSKWIEENFRVNDFTGIENVLENSPPELRSFIILNSLESVRQIKPDQKDFVLNLINQVRSDFNKIDKLPVEPVYFAMNAFRFGQLPAIYFRYGLNDEVLAAFEESIKNLNRIVKNLPPESMEKNYIIYTSFYSRFNGQYPTKDFKSFVDQNFERIYENIGKIENPRLRLSERLEFLRKHLEKSPNNN